jgi:hypothetical protein
MNASEIFDLWKSPAGFAWERIRVVCPAFNNLRRALNKLAAMLMRMESDEAQRIAISLLDIRRTLECQPNSFGDDMFAKFSGICGGRDCLRRRWGEEVCAMYDAMVEAAGALLGGENAMSRTLASQASGLEGTVGVWCHRTSEDVFRAHVAEDARFLHSLPEYRSAAAFEHLVVLGGLRRRGFGRLPEACLMTPRFRHLLHITWDSDGDDLGFGESALALGFNFKDLWRIEDRIVECGHPDCRRIGVVDQEDYQIELDLIEWATKRIRDRPDISNATLLTLGGGMALAVHNGGHVLVFNPDDGSVDEMDAHDLEVGDIFLTYEGEIDFGEPFEKEDDLVAEWRKDLKRAHGEDVDGFLVALRKEGIGIKNLRSCLDSWMSGRRPQQKASLELVCKVLGWGARKTRRLWEIFSQEHGRAIETGRAGKELEREAIGQWVEGSHIREVLAGIPRSKTGCESFSVQISGDTITLNAYVIDHISRDVCVDSGKIGRMMKLMEFEQWLK